MKYATTQATLGGFFISKSPQELIEGYQNPIIKRLHDTPLYLRGDKTFNLITKLNYEPDPTSLPNSNPIALMEGGIDSDANYLLTKSYAKWNNLTSNSVIKQVYQSINTTSMYYSNPWKVPVDINGTDGL